MKVVSVAVPVPLDQLFDYRCEDDVAAVPGARVRVPLGHRQVVGIVVACRHDAQPDRALKGVAELLDPEPLLDAHLQAFCRWLSRYYLHPLGEVLNLALTVPLRRGEMARVRERRHWARTGEDAGLPPDSRRRAPRQRRVLEALAAGPLSEPALRERASADRRVLEALLRKGWIREVPEPVTPTPPTSGPPRLNDAQRAAVDALTEQVGFGAFVLDGVTGSGKTEVYLSAITPLVARRRQALVLVPEISLTPQLRRRFEARFGGAVGVLHSGLGDAERTDVWLRARSGRLSVVLGTRSALFTPLADAGLIVVDEEHDGSFKQQDGLRYNARDGAVKRAQLLDVPIVLGSATPSLETLYNVAQGRYTRLALPDRAGGARMPRTEIVDLRTGVVEDGLAGEVLARIDATLARNRQVLVFLNRRGYAPVLACEACGWYGQCERCDARMVLHRRAGQLRCHHCGSVRRVPDLCPACGSSRLQPLGEGTERLERRLQARFPGCRLLRIDRDTTRSAASLETSLDRVRTGGPLILLGTQMLAKGHDFPGVTLAVVVNLDQALFSGDFRAEERAAQLVVQVAGRAGRGEEPGELLLQTRYPDHPLFREVLGRGYGAYARTLLEERRQARLPPVGHLALLRAEATRAEAAQRFLEKAAGAARPGPQVNLFGPMPCAMERRAGRYRYQLVAQAADRGQLHGFLARWVPGVRQLDGARRVRLALDVDPQEHV